MTAAKIRLYRQMGRTPRKLGVKNRKGRKSKDNSGDFWRRGAQKPCKRSVDREGQRIQLTRKETIESGGEHGIKKKRAESNNGCPREKIPDGGKDPERPVKAGKRFGRLKEKEVMDDGKGSDEGNETVIWGGGEVGKGNVACVTLHILENT